MLRLQYKSQDEIPEEFKDLYEERSGTWRLKLEDPVVPKGKLDEFRDNNIKLMKKLEELEGKLSGVDLEEYKELKKKVQEHEDKKLIDEGKIDELVQRKAMKIKQSFEDQLKELQKKAEQASKAAELYKSKLSSTLVDAEVQKAVLSVAKPREGAINDILLRAKQTWRVTDDGEVMPFDEKGELIQTDNGPLTFRDWAESLVEQAPYLFEGSGGGGASGSGNGGSAPKVIPRDDKDAFIANLDKIAKGEVKVSLE